MTRDLVYAADLATCSDRLLLLRAAQELEDLDACTSICDSRILAPRLRKIAETMRDDLPDPAHRCCVCQVAYVDSDSGYDTCGSCLRNV